MQRVVMQAMFVALMFCAQSSFAVSIKVGGRSLDLEPPQGYCQADKQHAERAIIESLEKNSGKSSVLLMVFAQCDELKNLRSGKVKYLQRYGQYVAPTGGDGTVKAQPVGTLREQIIENMAKNIQAISPGPDSKGSAAKTPRKYPDVQTGDVKSLGLLGSDADAVYVGSLQGFKAVSGDALKLASVGAVTLLNGIIVSTDLFAAYTGAPDIDGLLAQQKANVSSLIAKNK